MIDALVVGGGPAGSSAARELARGGFAVTVLERSAFPRTKVCGEYLSPAACAQLGQACLLEGVRRASHPIRRIVIGGFESQPVELRLPGEGALALARATLDSMLLDAARAAGAGVIRGCFLHAADAGGDVDVRYRTDDGAESTMRARVLVGADGAWSHVAQRCGLVSLRAERGRWAVGGHLIADGGGDALEMDVGAAGYFARNPLGGDRVNAMLVTSRPHTGIEADRIARAISAGRSGFDERALERRVAVGPLHYRPRAIARGRVLLCGDAAGLLDPFVGQGVAIALESSHAVVRAVRGILAGSASRARAAFVAERKAAVLPRTMLAAAVETLIRVRFLRERARRGLARDPRPAETVLAAVAGAVPAREALSLSALAGLLA